MKKIILSLAIIALVSGIVISGTVAFFTDEVTVTGNTFSTGQAPDVLKISADGSTGSWGEEIEGFEASGKIFPGFGKGEDKSKTVHLKNVAGDDSRVAVTPYVKPKCGVACKEAGLCDESAGGSQQKCENCMGKCHNLYGEGFRHNEGLQMKIVKVDSGETDLTGGFRNLGEYQRGRWCKNYVSDPQGKHCEERGNPESIITLDSSDTPELKTYFQLPETGEDQSYLAGGHIKFDVQFRGEEVTP